MTEPEQQFPASTREHFTELAPEIVQAHDAGRELERARIVAWLRSAVDLPALDADLADAIERGNHA